MDTSGNHSLGVIRVGHHVSVTDAARIADAIEADIRAGVISSGQPIPSQRQIVDRWGCAKVTAERAHGLLVRRGLVVPSGRAGTLVVDELPPRGYRAPSLEERVTALEKWRAQTEGRLASDQAADPEAPS